MPLMNLSLGDMFRYGDVIYILWKFEPGVAICKTVLFLRQKTWRPYKCGDLCKLAPDVPVKKIRVFVQEA